MAHTAGCVGGRVDSAGITHTLLHARRSSGSGRLGTMRAVDRGGAGGAACPRRHFKKGGKMAQNINFFFFNKFLKFNINLKISFRLFDVLGFRKLLRR